MFYLRFITFRSLLISSINQRSENVLRNVIIFCFRLLYSSSFFLPPQFYYDFIRLPQHFSNFPSFFSRILQSLRTNVLSICILWEENCSLSSFHFNVGDHKTSCWTSENGEKLWQIYGDLSSFLDRRAKKKVYYSNKIQPSTDFDLYQGDGHLTVQVELRTSSINSQITIDSISHQSKKKPLSHEWIE